MEQVGRRQAAVSRLAVGWSADLSEQVFARLQVLDEIAAGVRRRNAAELERIRTEMAGLIVSWRRLLQLHQAGEDGRCLRCRGWIRRRRWPCAVWTTAHASLITSDAVVGTPAATDAAPVPCLPETGALTPAGRAPDIGARPRPFVVRARPTGGVG